MGALDAFYTTWSQARTTFGEGTPKTGDEFDGSAQLRQMQSTIESAAPDDRWQGTASQAYAAKNAEHAAVYGKLADLDQRMAAEVTNAAVVVTGGRQNLAQTQSWVQSMAASIPGGQSAETMRMILASKGLSQVTDTMERSAEEMSAIGERIRGLGREYDEISGSNMRGNRDDASKLNSPTYTDDDDRTHDEKVADWLIKYNDITRRMTELAAQLPPPTAPYSVGKAYNEKKRKLLEEWGQLTQEAAELGIPIDPPTAQGATSSKGGSSAPTSTSGTIRGASFARPLLP
ncbi:EspA/EspE family type VII secretion system effector [Mycobacterium sp. NPDC051198]